MDKTQAEIEEYCRRLSSLEERKWRINVAMRQKDVTLVWGRDIDGHDVVYRLDKGYVVKDLWHQSLDQLVKDISKGLGI